MRKHYDIIEKYDCPRYGPKVTRLAKSFGFYDNNQNYGHDVKTRKTDHLLLDGNSDYYYSGAHRMICAELDRREEAGEVLNDVQYLEDNQLRYYHQLHQREITKWPDGNPYLHIEGQIRNEEIWIKHKASMCKSCHFPPKICGCSVGMTAFGPEPFVGEQDIQVRLKTVKCLNCGVVFMDCKCKTLVEKVVKAVVQSPAVKTTVHSIVQPAKDFVEMNVRDDEVYLASKTFPWFYVILAILIVVGVILL